MESAPNAKDRELDIYHQVARELCLDVHTVVHVMDKVAKAHIKSAVMTGTATWLTYFQLVLYKKVAVASTIIRMPGTSRHDNIRGISRAKPTRICIKVKPLKGLDAVVIADSSPPNAAAASSSDSTEAAERMFQASRHTRRRRLSSPKDNSVSATIPDPR